MHPKTRLLYVGLLIALLAQPVGPVRALIPDPNDGQAATVAPEVIRALGENGVAPVLITLQPVAGGRAALAAAQAAVTDGARAEGFTPTQRYHTVAGMAGAVTPAALEALRRDPRVAAIDPDMEARTAFSETSAAAGVPVARAQYAAFGQGITVAVIDDGFQTGHARLAGKIVATHCFAGGGGCPDGASESTLATPLVIGGNPSLHGTDMARIIAQAPEGIAPSSKLVLVRVFRNDGTSYVSDWVAALEWLNDNLADTGVRVVNMSIATLVRFPGDCDGVAGLALMAQAVNALRANGVVVVAASGNSGDKAQISAPACLSSAVGVGATYDSTMGRKPATGDYPFRDAGVCHDDTTSVATVACFSNVSPALDLFAPGVEISFYNEDGNPNTIDWRTAYGTSVSAAVTSGLVAALLSRKAGLSAAEAEAALKATSGLARGEAGVPVINLRAALQQVGAEPLTRRAFVPMVQ